MTLFEKATRNKYRFESEKGLLTVEQLWDLTLTAINKIAISINKSLKDLTEESFIDIRPNPKKSELQDKLEICKHIIAVKQDENKAAREASEKRAKKDKILSILESKKDERFTKMTEDELIKELESL